MLHFLTTRFISLSLLPPLTSFVLFVFVFLSLFIFLPHPFPLPSEGRSREREREKGGKEGKEGEEKQGKKRETNKQNTKTKKGEKWEEQETEIKSSSFLLVVPPIDTPTHARARLYANKFRCRKWHGRKSMNGWQDEVPRVRRNLHKVVFPRGDSTL